MRKKFLNSGVLSKFSKVLSIMILIIMVGTVGYYGYKKYDSKKTTMSSTKYSLTKVKRGNLAVTVVDTSTVTGINDVNIYSSNNGTVQGLTVKAGDIVKQGDVFCKIDDTNTQQVVKDAEYGLQQKEIQLQALKLQMDNLYIKAPIDGTVKAVYVSSGDDIASTKPAYGGMAILTAGEGNALEIPVPFPSTSGKITEVDIKAGQTVKKGDTIFKLDDSTLKNSIDEKNSEIAQAKEDLQIKEKDFSNTTVSTPVSGVVSVLNIKNGQVLENSNLALIATITDTSKMEITLPVDELDINKVQIGQKATITIDDISGTTFTGEVKSVAQNGTVTNLVQREELF